jgi:hypothetical protein
VSSKRRLRRKACESKRSYDTPEAAANQAKKARLVRDERVYSYKCEYGNHWHIGHTPHQQKMEESPESTTCRVDSPE